MAMLLFKVDQHVIVLVPELVVGACGPFSFPNESDFVQKSLSIKSKFVLLMIAPLQTNPVP
jgi:hypothetical protein